MLIERHELRRGDAIRLPDASAPLQIHHADNLAVTARLPSNAFDLIYLDPPFNTGKVRARPSYVTQPDGEAARRGFHGRSYSVDRVAGAGSYSDAFDDYLGFVEPRLREAHRLLAETGSLFLHLDCCEVHYAKVLLDSIFGRASFVNEIVWAYDYGARSKRRWSRKHDNLLWYAKDPDRYTFHYDAIDRIPYLAPDLVTPENAARGKTPTDTWWHTIVSPTGREKTGYPTQKPLGVLNRVVRVHSSPGDLLLDSFAGSGSFGEAAVRNGRRCVLIDDNPAAIEVMRRRLAFAQPAFADGGAS